MQAVSQPWFKNLLEDWHEMKIKILQPNYYNLKAQTCYLAVAMETFDRAAFFLCCVYGNTFSYETKCC